MHRLVLHTPATAAASTQPADVAAAVAAVPHATRPASASTARPRTASPGQAPPMQHAERRPAAAHAARRFEQLFGADVRRGPVGRVLATRADLGLRPMDPVMVDVGGEGQKLVDFGRGEPMRSGNLHAINVNAQDRLSPGATQLQQAQGEAARLVHEARIPHLVHIPSWPDSMVAGAAGLLPFEAGFAQLTLMEGTPLHAYHADELARTTSRDGWIVLQVHPQYAGVVDRMAEQHNGGTVWHDAADDGFTRFVLPPHPSRLRDAEPYRALMASSNPHQLFDALQAIQLHRLGITPDLSTANVARFAGANGEIDFEQATGRHARAGTGTYVSTALAMVAGAGLLLSPDEVDDLEPLVASLPKVDQLVLAVLVVAGPAFEPALAEAISRGRFAGPEIEASVQRLHAAGWLIDGRPATPRLEEAVRRGIESPAALASRIELFTHPGRLRSTIEALPKQDGNLLALYAAATDERERARATSLLDPRHGPVDDAMARLVRTGLVDEAGRLASAAVTAIVLDPSLLPESKLAAARARLSGQD